MAVAELLTEIAKPEYVKKSDAEIASALNEWHTIYVPCPTSALRSKFAELNLIARLKVAREKALADDTLWSRCIGLVDASDGTEPVMFDAKPLEIESLFHTLAKIGVINETECIWLCDLGRKQWTVARRCFARDVDAADIAAAKELKPLADKVAARRQYVADEIARLQAELNESHDALQARDEQLKIIADVNHVPAWEK